MRSARPFIWLLIVLAVAGAIFVLARPDRPRVDTASEAMLIQDFASERVARVEIAQLLDGAVLAREPDGWLVAELPTAMRRELLVKEGRPLPPEEWRRADGTRVASALGSFGGLSEGVVVSENPEKRSLYQVDATGLAVRLIDADGKTVADLVIGKSGPDFGSSYVRRADENAVRLIDRLLVGVFSPVASDWLERKPQ
jgi:Domain of unknown function (DUF4340)